ncbi:MAG: DUF4834 family protein [Janthinobacterium lividum]
MGYTLSLLVFFLLVRFVLPRVLRALLGGFVRQQVHKAQQGGFTPPGGPQVTNNRATAPGQVRVDYVPPKPQTERKGEFRGGEYVEYEEV